MPKLTCLCGESINLSQIPNPHGFKLIPERVFDTLVERLVDVYAQSPSQAEFETQVHEELYLQAHGIAQAYACPTCGRLAVFSRASDTSPALWFSVEKAQQGSSLRTLMNQTTEE